MTSNRTTRSGVRSADMPLVALRSPSVRGFVLTWLVSGVAGCAAPASPPPRAIEPEAAPGEPARFISPYSYAWYMRGELALARSEHAAAAEAFRHALAGGDEDPLLYARLAQSLEGSGDVDEANAALAAGLDLDADSEAVWLAYGAIAEGRGNDEHAIDAYERAQRAAPHSATAPLALHRLLLAAGQRERANELLACFARSHPERAARVALEAALGADDGVALEQAVDAWWRATPTDRTLLRRAARRLAALDRHAAALELFDAVGARDDDARVRLQSLIALGRFAEARTVLAGTPPDVLGGPLAVAEAYLAIGRADEAFEALQQVPDETPGKPIVLAETELALGHYGQAALHFARIPEASPSFARAREGLKQALQAGNLSNLANEL